MGEGNTTAWPIGRKLYLLSGRGVPRWLHSFAGTVVGIGRTRYRVRVPVDDDRERWVPATQLATVDPWPPHTPTAPTGAGEEGGR